MLNASALRIMALLDDDALVLDVGGAADPFLRADWVIDLVPYESRGQLSGPPEPAQERFGPESWVQRDICDRQPWPFADRQFDFAICSHTLEDVRDPVWVGQELQRVAAAGYIEAPTVQEELTYGIQGPWVGWGHHHWLLLMGEAKIEFLFKHHVVNRAGSHLPAGAMDGLAPAERAQTFWWQGGFEVRERFMLTAGELDGFLAAIARQSTGRSSAPGSRRRWPGSRYRRARS
jgi:hypothetical protein